VWKRSQSAVPSDRKIDVSENRHRRILADFEEREKSNEKLFTRRNGTFFRVKMEGRDRS
jgi:transposase-like protein